MADLGPTPQVVRRVTRVVLVDDDKRILLFRMMLGRGERWIMPGGGLASGESYQQAAIRELREETGINEVTLGPCVWRRRFQFSY